MFPLWGGGGWNPGWHVAGWCCVIVDEYSPSVDHIVCSQLDGKSFFRPSIEYSVVMRVVVIVQVVCNPSPVGGKSVIVWEGSTPETLCTTSDDTLGHHTNGYGRSRNSLGTSKFCGMRKKNQLPSRSWTQKPPCPFARPIPILVTYIRAGS